MVNPRTVNAGIIVPLTGADVDLWGELDVNPNMVAIDGYIGGVQTIALTNVPVTLSAPAGFTATPSPGPTQSQNRVLRFTGVLTANVAVTLPLPGSYLIDNRTTGPFVLTLQGLTATEVVGIDQGSIVEVYNDGANVRFVNLGRVGQIEHWGAFTGSMPAWVQACTVKPYLMCDSSVYNIADFPWLGTRYGAHFGGNGISTFGVPDLRGRYPLAYDNTGTRVTVAGCGINGQIMGSALNAQSVALLVNQLAAHYHVAGIYDPQHSHAYERGVFNSNQTGGGSFGVLTGNSGTNTGNSGTGVRLNSSNGLDTTYSAGSGDAHNNMPNTQVTGIWVVKT